MIYKIGTSPYYLVTFTSFLKFSISYLGSFCPKWPKNVFFSLQSDVSTCQLEGSVSSDGRRLLESVVIEKMALLMTSPTPVNKWLPLGVVGIRPFHLRQFVRSRCDLTKWRKSTKLMYMLLCTGIGTLLHEPNSLVRVHRWCWSLVPRSQSPGVC